MSTEISETDASALVASGAGEPGREGMTRPEASSVVPRRGVLLVLGATDEAQLVHVEVERFVGGRLKLDLHDLAGIEG